MFAQHELANHVRVVFLQFFPDIGLESLEGGPASQKPVNFIRCKAFFEDALDGLGIVHEARSFGEQVFKFIHNGNQFIRWNRTQVSVLRR